MVKYAPQSRRNLHTYTHVVFACLFSVISYNVYGAEILDLNTALQNTYTACVGIDDNLHDLKVLAGVNTAVSAVGTGLGVGATVVGFVKSNKDKEAEKLEELIKELRELEEGTEEPTKAELQLFLNEFNSSYDVAIKDLTTTEAKLDELNKQSKNLGNWRTGLLAGNTATNIAGAVIAGQTINKEDIQGQVNACISATKDLSNSMMQARLNGENISEAQSIYEACRKYEHIDISSIKKRGTGSMIASSIGAVVGGVGTVTSGLANSNKIREDNSDTGNQKEKQLNTASNVLSIGATAASVTATAFNATQIAAIKKIAAVSEACTGVLK